MSETVGDHNVERMASDLVAAMRDRMTAYRTPHLLVPFGDDFKFKYAAVQFSNMDRLIDHINSRPGQYGVRIQYSTLSEYFEAVARSDVAFTTLSGDFFPYADNADSFWTGYYTTRPQLKRISRTVSAQLRAADLLLATAETAGHPELGNLTDDLRHGLVEAKRNAALFLHHDAITGTARETVVLDYLARMTASYDTATSAVEQLTAAITALPGPGPEWRLDRDLGTFEVGSHAVTVMNTVSWARTEIVYVPVATRYVTVRDWDGNVVPNVQVNAVWSPESSTDPGALPTQYRACIRAHLPALSVSVYTVDVYDRAPGGAAPIADLAQVHVVSRADVVGRDRDDVRFVRLDAESGTRDLLKLRNDAVEVQLSPDTGLIESVLSHAVGRVVALGQELAQYSTFSSGAYIFRPDHGPDPIPDVAEAQPIVRVIHGPVVSVANVQLGRYVVQVEVVSGRDDIEVRIDAVAGDNREIVTRWRSSLDSDDLFHSNDGIRFVERRRRPRDPISANYYPSVSGARIADQTAQVTILTGHTSGVTSPESGVLEFLIHRSLLQDDGRGLAQGVVDRTSVPITMRLLLESTNAVRSSADYRRRAIDLETPAIVLRGRAESSVATWRDLLASRKLMSDLPENVHVLSMNADKAGNVAVIRLENFDDGIASIPVDLSTLCCRSRLGATTVDVRQVRETSLTAVRDASSTTYGAADAGFEFAASGVILTVDLETLTATDLSQIRQNTDEEGVFISDAALMKANNQGPGALQRRLMSAPDVSVIELGPGQLRTFVLTLERRITNPNHVEITDSSHSAQRTSRFLQPGTFEVVVIGMLSASIMITAVLLARYSKAFAAKLNELMLSTKPERRIV